MSAQPKPLFHHPKENYSLVLPLTGHTNKQCRQSLYSLAFSHLAQLFYLQRFPAQSQLHTTQAVLIPMFPFYYMSHSFIISIPAVLPTSLWREMTAKPAWSESSSAAAMSCPSFVPLTDGCKSFQRVVKMEMVPLVWNGKCCT